MVKQNVNCHAFFKRHGPNSMKKIISVRQDVVAGYANSNKSTALQTFANHDKQSAFLSYSKSQSDRWLAEINGGKTEICEQLELF